MVSLAVETKHSKFHIGHSFMAVGVFLSLLLSILMSTVPSHNAYAIGTNDIAVLSNQEREKNGVASLTLNEKLSAAAQAKADHMVANGYFEHTAPDGTTGWYFIAQQGYAYAMAGENLAASNEGAYAMVSGKTGWMYSPGHRANLLNPKYTEVGYGIARKGEFQGYSDVYFVVALYARPVSTQAIAAPDGSVASPTPTTPSSGNDSSDLLVPGTESYSGTSTQLSKGRFHISSTVALIIAIISGILVIIGIIIDIRRLIKHGAGIHTYHPRH